jgi:hypothetical protein
MSPLLFIVRRSLINILKGLLRKPAMLALYILLALLLVGLLAMVLMMPGNYGQGDPRLFRSILTALTFLAFYFSLRQGIEKGSSLFRAADVNLVFAGPFRPNDALLYGFIKQLGGMLLIVFVAAFQIPNLSNSFALKSCGIWVILLAVAVCALSYPIFGMTVYAYTSKSARRKRVVSFLLNAGLVAVLLIFLYQLYDTGNVQKAFYGTFDNPAVPWFPVIGWTRDIAAAAVDGLNSMFSIGLSLMIAVIAAFIVILYRLNLDYYEEVLAATEFREASIAAKKEGRNLQFNQKARRKIRQPIFGEGAAALFGKNMLELRKSAFVLFFDRTSAIIIISAFAFKYLITALPAMPVEIGRYSMALLLAFSVYMLFLMQMQGRWPQELGRHFIFTLPASAPKKLFFVTLSDHIKNLIDGTTLFVIAGVIFKAQPPVIVACIIAYALLGALFIYTDVLARRLFGSIHAKPLLVFLKLFLTIFLLSPGIALMIVAASLTHLELPAVIVFGLWTSVATGAVFGISSAVFKNIEYS